MAAKSILIEAPVKRHAFLIENGSNSILIDPGARHHADLLINAITKDMAMKDIRYIILQSNDYLNITSIDALMKAGFEGQIICNETGIPYIEEALNHNIITIASLDYKLKIGEAVDLTFIPAPFLPFHECFITYDHHHQTLYSSHLFSQDIQASDDLIKMINAFHEFVLPGADYVRQNVKKLSAYNIKRIYPRLGKIISGLNVQAVIEDALTYDFYNTTQVINHDKDHKTSYNYEMICNHMLKKLTSLFHRYEIASVFIGSNIALALSTDITIDKTTLIGYKLWNYFFNLIYEKKGVTWLAVLEPTVKKYQELYGLHEPSIYTTDIYLQHAKINALNVSKIELASKVKELESEISETTDKMLRDSTTDLYNEHFMANYLEKEFQDKISPDSENVLMLFNIDNLVDINKRYGVQEGDETIRSLTYVLNNIKMEKTMLFKQHGPGIFAYTPKQQIKDIQEHVIKCRNLIQESELFIEPIHVSVSLALLSEIDDRFEPHVRVSSFIELVLQRMQYAKMLGHSQVVDHTSEERDFVDGVVLIVDEDETYQNMMIKIFERIQFKVIIKKDIYEAYETLKTEPVSMIISEINLSKLDGFQFKHMVNQTKDLKVIPFIIISHHKNVEVVRRANQLDVDLILQKPIFPEELTGYIKRMQQKWRKL